MTAHYRYHGDEATGEGITVDFAVNIMSPTPQWLSAALHPHGGDLASYPSAAATAAAAASIAAAHDLAPETVLPLAGGAEGFALLAHLPHATRGVLLVHPSFTEPDAIFAALDHPVAHHVLAPPYHLDAAAVRALAAHPAQLVILGNPTNPTGVLHAPDAILALCRPGRVVVVDEAFMDLVVAPRSLLTAAATTHAGQLLILRSLTKSTGLAGLRCGYACGDPTLLAELIRPRPHWPVSTPALRAIETVMGPLGRAHRAALQHRIAAHRAEMITRLPAAGLELAADSAAAFLLVRHAFGPAGDAPARAALAAAGIAVRRADTFPGLDGSYWRLAVRPPHEVDTLCQALDTVRHTLR